MAKKDRVHICVRIWELCRKGVGRKKDIDSCVITEDIC